MPGSVELFSKYLNPAFVETGSCSGDGILCALSSGFKKIYSIEMSNTYYDVCCGLFGNREDVCLFHGNSSEVLKRVIDGISVPCTFWLDAHYSGGDTAGSDRINPLMDELDAIKSHPIKNHTILVDDMRLWCDEFCGFDADDIKNKILEINPNYKFILEDGITQQDILVATV